MNFLRVSRYILKRTTFILVTRQINWNFLYIMYKEMTEGKKFYKFAFRQKSKSIMNAYKDSFTRFTIKGWYLKVSGIVKSILSMTYRWWISQLLEKSQIILFSRSFSQENYILNFGYKKEPRGFKNK